MLGSRALPAVCIRAASVEAPDVWRQQLRALATLSATTFPSRPSGTDGRHKPSTALGRWLTGAAAAGAAALVGVTVAIAGGSFSAHCEAPAPAAAFGGDNTAEGQASTTRLHDWLASQGADVSKVEVRSSKAGPGAGLGLFANTSGSSPRPGTPWWSWLWPRRGAPAAAASQQEPVTLASFPLSAAITVQTVCEDPQLGETFSWMLEKQLLDERTALMVFLLIERLRGDKSKYAQWIRSLPSSFDVPIAFTEAELRELRGTALYDATAVMTKRMRETWSRLEAPLARVAREVGLPAPRLEDWLWAYCVFWSRGQSLPVPEKGSASSALVGHYANGHGNGSNGSNGSGEKIPVQILEGLVPGLDFCNHRHEPPPQCWWEVVAPDREGPKQAAARSAGVQGGPSAGAGAGAGADGPVVRLQLHAGAQVRAGDELFISYGDKSNEELLMLYGFAIERNPLDMLMLYCPLPPRSEWDDVMHARVELLQAYGLRPQFFLPYPDRVQVLESGAGRPAEKGRGGKAGRKAAKAPAAAAAGDGVDPLTGSDAPPLVLPSDVLDTLEVFVLNFQELAVRGKALQTKMEERRANRAAGAPLAALPPHSPVLDLVALRGRLSVMTHAELRHYLHALGLRMATLTTLIRLLEIKVIDLEGAEGTGPLEADQQLLAALDRPQGSDPPGSSSSSGGSDKARAPASASEQAVAAGQAGFAAALSDAAASEVQQEQRRRRRLRSAVVYRMGQKQLARTWVVRAKGELANLLALMRDMQARQEALERGSK